MMQVWPALKVLAHRMRSAAVLIGKSGATIAGDLPPSSSVTGVRLRAALAITARPVAPEPVKIRWSKGSDEKAGPRPPPSSKKASLSSGKYFGEDLDQQLGQAPRILRHLHHRPVARGENADERRKAQIERIVPWNDDADHAERLGDDPVACTGEDHEVDVRRRGCIHPFSRLAASLSRRAPGKISANVVSNSLRLP